MTSPKMAAKTIVCEPAAELELLRSVLVVVCAWCNKIRDVDHVWHHPETFGGAPERDCISHGICPPCAVFEMEEYSRLRGNLYLDSLAQAGDGCAPLRPDEEKI